MCLAVPGLILSVEGNGLERSGVVRFGQVERRVNLAFTPEAAVDDYVIVHVGCAISVIDQVEAERLFTLLQEADVVAVDSMAADAVESDTTETGS